MRNLVQHKPSCKQPDELVDFLYPNLSAPYVNLDMSLRYPVSGLHR